MPYCSTAAPIAITDIWKPIVTASQAFSGNSPFGGRQSARSIHFIIAWLLVLFFLVHIAMVLLAGPVNEVRSMITGWFTLPRAKDGDA